MYTSPLFCGLLFMVTVCHSDTVRLPNVASSSIQTNTIQKIITVLENKSPGDETRALKKVFLSNRSITCNDGSQAGFYLRKSHSSKKWIIFLEGGWYCYDNHSCRNRWLRLRHLMTSSQWPETRDVGGILSPNPEENPYWWNANHVFVPYCTSDSWSGSRMSREGMFSFMGAQVVQQVIRDVVPLGLENSTDLLLTGSSAGGTGAMINLDPVRELLHDTMKLHHIAVRGVCDSGWFLDRAPYAPSGAHQPVEAIRRGMELWQGKVPKRCRGVYSDEPWRCYFGYRLYPTLRAPLFVFQWLFDEAQMTVDNVGAPVTKQQWDYIHKMGDALRHSFENVTSVFAPSCISHSILTKRDWQYVKVNDVSIAQALHCWERQPPRKNMRSNKSSALNNAPNLKKNVKKMGRGKDLVFASMTSAAVTDNPNQNKRRRRKKHRNKNRGQRRNKKRKSPHDLDHSTTTTDRPQRPERSVLRAQKRPRSHTPSTCNHRLLERCSWPQCNHSCPRLHNPFTGEEMDFLELLKSFGLDMESVANALGIDLITLNSMDQAELLNLLTQQSN